MNYQKIFLLLTLFSIQLNATIWRVDNVSTHDADFADLQSAHDGASDGDTIYVAGTGYVYGNCTLTKKLTIIGSGYFLDENPNTQLEPFASRVTTVTFDPGSEGSLITGFYMFTIVVNTDFIIISKVMAINAGGAPLVTINANYTVVIKSYLDNTRGSFNPGTISLSDGVSFNLIANNYLNNAQYLSIRADQSPSNSFINNTLHGIYSNANTLKNNILVEGTLTGSDNIIMNNLSWNSNFGTDNGNQENVDMSTVFVGYPDQGSNSTDGRWQLAPGSPAISAGENGVDCGMFGGSDPYVLSGMPAIPAIYTFTSPDSLDGNPILPVQIQGKVHR